MMPRRPSAGYLCIVLILLCQVSLCVCSSFTCDNGQTIIPSVFVNDDFCDCQDGSDEMTTHACAINTMQLTSLGLTVRDKTIGEHIVLTTPTTPIKHTSINTTALVHYPRFRCANKGFLSKLIPKSFLLDGVCDCCDGSDESTDTASTATSTATVCPNSCAQAAVDYLTQSKHSIAKYAKGVEIRAKVAKSLPTVRKVLQKKLSDLEAYLALIHKDFSAADAYYQAQKTQEAYNVRARYEYFLNEASYRHTHIKWLLGIPIRLNDGSMRPTVQLGNDLSWLSLTDKCFKLKWPQKRFGAFGLHTDWYLMELCPLHNATQTTLPPPAVQEDEAWKTKEASTDATSQQQTQTQTQKPFEPESFVLGYWDGKLTSSVIIDPTKNKKNKDVSFTEETTTTRPYFTLKFLHGQQCWNGPQRSVEVQAICGQQHKLIEVLENGICKYKMTFETPLACFADFLKEWQSKLGLHEQHFKQPKEDL